MPGDNPILRHWQAQRKILHDNCSLLRKEMTVDAIHDLRVAIKKIRSYQKLHSALCEKKQPGELTTTRNLFSVFGKHRNIDIAKKLLGSFLEKNQRSPNSLLVYLQLLQDQITPFCQQTIMGFSEEELDNFTQELQNDIEILDAMELSSRVKDLIEASTKTVEHDLAHFKKKSHLIRKHLKDIFYWSKIFEQEIFFTKPQLKSLDKTLDHLGSIQDHEVLKRNLKNFRKTILVDSLADYGVVKKIELNVGKKKNELLDKANKMAEDLISQTDNL